MFSLPAGDAPTWQWLRLVAPVADVDLDRFYPLFFQNLLLPKCRPGHVLPPFMVNRLLKLKRSGSVKF
jgi:hypothetical protein